MMDTYGWDLHGRNALVTGAAKRLGRAVALALAGEGAHVVIHYRHSERQARTTADEIRALGVRAWTVSADLADEAQAEGLIDRAVREAGPIDILINSASIFPVGTLAESAAADFLDNFRVNALSPLLVGRAFARQGRPGAIVNFLDARMVDHDGAHVPYTLSKRALASLTMMMALEFAPTVRVNAVAPGAILPPPGADESVMARLAEATPLKRIGAPEAVTEAVLFLLRSEFVTGQVLYVDGGRHMKGCFYGQ